MARVLPSTASKAETVLLACCKSRPENYLLAEGLLTNAEATELAATYMYMNVLKLLRCTLHAALLQHAGNLTAEMRIHDLSRFLDRSVDPAGRPAVHRL